MRTLAGPVSIHICFCHLLSATGAIVNVNVYNITEILCEREDREELLERLKDPLSNNQGTKREMYFILLLWDHELCLLRYTSYHKLLSHEVALHSFLLLVVSKSETLK